MIVFLPKKAEWFGPFHLLAPLEKVLVKIGFNEDFVYEAIITPIVDKIPVRPFEIIQAIRNLAPWRRDVVIQKSYDHWSFDYKIAKIVLPGLYAIKKNKQGIPGSFVSDTGTNWHQPDLFDEYEELAENTFQNDIKRWDETVDKMIFSFENLIFGCETSLPYWEPYWEPMNKEEREEYLRKSTLAHLFKDDKVCYKINDEKYETFNSKMNEGFELFGKYFTSLYI